MVAWLPGYPVAEGPYAGIRRSIEVTLVRRMSRDDILRSIAGHRDELRALHVRVLALFGSHARDEASPASDIDFLVDLEKKTFDAYMDVKEYLERLFGRRVDLVMKSALKDELREAVLREAALRPPSY